MNNVNKVALLALAAALTACAGGEPAETAKGGQFDDSGLTIVEPGAADGHTPYQGAMSWDTWVDGHLDSTWYEYYMLEVTEDASAYFEVTSDQTDTYLYLYRYSGNGWRVIAKNDDCSYDNYDSCLEQDLSAGYYLALVTSYDALTSYRRPEADYSLRVNCAAGAGLCSGSPLCGESGEVDVPTEFVSATQDYGLIRPFARTTGTDLESATGSDERTVEEGDIYRVLSDGFILNLNAYRGLQVLDVRDPSQPEIVGRAQVAGTPVEMYVVGDIAYVLLNNWQGYYGTRSTTRVESYNGGVVIAIDLSDRTQPYVLDRERIPGSISTSRMAREGDSVALYAVASKYGQYPNEEDVLEWSSHTLVSSYALVDGRIAARDEKDLGGYVGAIQATPNALAVARNYGWRGDRNSHVAVFDISNPAGWMTELGEVAVSGRVAHKSNMDIRDGVLRVVSGATWGGTQANHLETFAVADLKVDELTEEIAHCEFGDGQNLFGTIFMEDRAFFVTYLRVDPFHAFALDTDGNCQEVSEFEVSGWNNYFRPVFDDSRLVGIGINDEDGSRTVSVSLYDTTDLANPNPLVARAEVDTERSWSEATWDDKAFSVLEGAISVQSDGTTETGMVLAPFTGWSEDDHEYVSAVQIFTFSESSLTRRGVMLHGSPVRRTFQSDDETVANLSDLELRLFAPANPDAPEELGRVSLAPNYSDFLVYGDYGARLDNSAEFYWSWWGPQADLPPSTIQIVALSEHADTAAPVAEIQIPAGARISQVGDLLLVADTRQVEEKSVTHIEVFDMSNPASPVLAGMVDGDAINASGYGGFPDCINCRSFRYFPQPAEQYALNKSLVFVERVQRSEILGHEEVCNYRAIQPRCGDDPTREIACEPIYRGWRRCTSLDGADATCTGEFTSCRSSEDGEVCEPIAFEDIPTTESCYDYDRTRNWQSFNLHTVDLTNPAAPVFAEVVELPEGEEAVSVLADGDVLFVTVKRPEAAAEGDTHSYARYYVRRVDFHDPSAAEISDAANVPGTLVAVDGAVAFTRNQTWRGDNIETSLVRSILCNGTAYEQHSVEFGTETVDAIVLDGEDHVLVSHRLAWQDTRELGDDVTTYQELTILADHNLQHFGTYEVDEWANLRTATSGRALFSVGGGVLVVNTEHPRNPYAQAFFPVRGWPSKFNLLSDRLIFAAGRYGLYDFDLGFFNLFSER